MKNKDRVPNPIVEEQYSYLLRELKKGLKEYGVDKFSEDYDFPRSTLYQFLRDNSNPSLKTSLALAFYLGVSLEFLE